MTPAVNYNRVAATYDQRATGSYLRDVSIALSRLAGQLKARRVLDLGCGTGRSLAGYPADANRRYVGLDFSGGMLAQAQRLNREWGLVQASAPQPPLCAQSFELITSVMSFHHFPQQAQVVAEAYRLLRPGGALAIVNIDPRDPDLRWPIYDYFTGTYEADLARFPAVAAQTLMLAQAGFQHIDAPVVERVRESVRGRAILADYWLRKDSTSQLILLSDAAYQRGLAQIRAVVARHGEAALFETRLNVQMVYGYK